MNDPDPLFDTLRPLGRLRKEGEIYAPPKLADYWAWLREEGCVICKQPPSIHHCIGGSILTELGVQHGKSQKNSDWLVLPLCYNHHQGREGLHAIGVRTWEARYGSQVSFLDAVNGRLTFFDLFEQAGLSRRKP